MVPPPDKQTILTTSCDLKFFENEELYFFLQANFQRLNNIAQPQKKHCLLFVTKINVGGLACFTPFLIKIPDVREGKI